MAHGIMNTDVTLLGTGLKLKAGTIVRLLAATNIPNGRGMWFAAPVEDRDDWHGGDEDSILLDEGDCRVLACCEFCVDRDGCDTEYDWEC